MVLYYITDRLQFPGSAQAQRERLLAKIAEAANAGIDYIQLRERDLAARDLEALAREAVQIVRDANTLRRKRTADTNRDLGNVEGDTVQVERETRNAKPETRLLINSRTDVALACGADGVHLRADDIAPSEARALWAKAPGNRKLETRRPVFAVSCHTPAEVRLAEAHGADFAVFAPVFEKTTAPQRAGVGIEALREACRAIAIAPCVEGVGASRMAVLALGGVTVENARLCIEAGAAGIAAIRLFQDNDVAEVIARLRPASVRPL